LAPAISITIDPGPFVAASAAPTSRIVVTTGTNMGASSAGRVSRPARAAAPGKQMLRRDVVPTRDFRYNRSRCVGFRNDPTFVFRPPPAPAPNPNADIDTTAAL